MRIIICIKQVPDSGVPIDFDIQKGGLREENIVYVINETDEYAIEEGLRIKEDIGAEITVITLGPPQSENALRRCLAMGVDRVIRLWDEAFTDSDAFVIGLILTKAIARLEYDLILCGSQSYDGANAQVGVTMAELLSLPQVSNIVGMKIFDGEKKAKVIKLLDSGDQIVIECSLPGVFFIEKGITEPRYPTLQKRLEAQKAAITTYNAESLGLSESEVGIKGSMIMNKELSIPRPKTKRMPVPDSSLSVEERIQFYMSAGAMEKEGSQVVQGSAIEAADKVVQYLVEKKFIRKRESCNNLTRTE